MIPFFILLLITIGLSFSQDVSKEVLIELQTGLRQKAILIGIEGDTVILGGKINGQSTVVRLHKDRIKSIQKLGDSTVITEKEVDTTSIDETSPHDWLGHMLILPPESKGLDSSFLITAQNLMLQLLKETGGMPVLIPDSVELVGLDAKSLLKKMKTVGALGLIGSFWQANGDSLFVQFKSIRIGRDSTTTLTSSRGTRGQWAHWLLSGHPWIGLEKVSGVPLRFKSESTFARVWVDTDPDSAWISVEGSAPVCKSPCRVLLPADTAGQVKTSILASWTLENRLWAGKMRVYAESGDSLNAHIKLQPSRATLQITSHPSGAEIFPSSEPWTLNHRPLGRTPLIINDFRSGEVSMLATFPGFQDTILRLNPDPTGKNVINVNLKAIVDPSQMEDQAIRLHAKNKLLLGKSLIGTSLAPFLVGSALIWLSNKDFDRAQQLKFDLEQPSTGSGPHFNAVIADNKKAVDDGQRKILVGGSLIGLGALLAAIGFSLWF